MKTGKRRWIVLAVVLALAAGWVWFSWPRSLPQLFPGFAWEKVETVSGTTERWPEETLRNTDSLSPDVPELAPLMAEYQSALWRRDLLGTAIDWLPGNRSRTLTPGEITFMELSFGTAEGALDIRVSSGEVRLMTWPNGDFGAASYRCSKKDLEPLLEHTYQTLRGLSKNES